MCKSSIICCQENRRGQAETPRSHKSQGKWRGRRQKSVRDFKRPAIPFLRAKSPSMSFPTNVCLILGEIRQTSNTSNGDSTGSQHNLSQWFTISAFNVSHESSSYTSKTGRRKVLWMRDCKCFFFFFFSLQIELKLFWCANKDYSVIFSFLSLPLSLCR